MTFRLSSNDKSEHPTIASLFSGGGLVEVGAITAGFRPIWGVEFDPDKPELSSAIADCYETNIGTHLVRQRVQDVDWSQLDAPDLLWASPVCTRMSRANLNPCESQQDVELAVAIASAISTLQPKAFCLENVRAYSKSHSVQLIRDTLKNLGYGIDEVIINASDYAVPQSRIRFFLRAIHGQLPPALPSIVLQKVGWHSAIADLLPTLPKCNLAPWQIERLPPLLKATLGESETRRILSGIPSQDIPGAFLIERSGARSDRSLLVRAASEPSWTLRASIGTDQNGNNRNAVMNVLLESGRVLTLTPRALARLQTLPDSYWLPAEIRIACPLIGNGVPCQLVQVIFSGIKPLLKNQGSEHNMVAIVKTIPLGETIQRLQTQEEQLRARLDNLRTERKNLKEYQKVESSLWAITQRKESLEAYSQLSSGMTVSHPKKGIGGVITSLTLTPGGMPEAWVRWSDSSVSVPEQPLSLLETLSKEMGDLPEFAANKSLSTRESTTTDAESHVPADRLDRKVSEALTSTQSSASITQYLSIADIQTGGGTQSRAELNWEAIAEYAEDMREGAIFKPIVVFYDGKDYWLADGFHRIHAATKAGLIEIAVDVHQGSLRDAILYSVGANANHGLRRTNADKRRVVEKLLRDEEWGQWSDNAIARACGVSQPFVGKMRVELCPTYNGYKSERKGLDGRTLKTANIGKSFAQHHPVLENLLQQPETIDVTENFSNLVINPHLPEQEAVQSSFTEPESYPVSKNMLSPQDLLPEPASPNKQLLPSLPPNADIPPNELPPTPATLINRTALAQGTPDVVANEMAIGITHISPVQLAWVIRASASNGLSDAHLKAVIKAAKLALNERYHPEYLARRNKAVLFQSME